MKITVLVENTSNDPHFGAEHGLSLYIQTETHTILFDMGQSDLFAANAEMLGIDLADVDLAVLSHGHYDHGGGLSHFLEVNKKAPVFVNRHAFEPHYNGTEKYIGLDTTLKTHPRLIFTDDEYTIVNRLTLYSCNQHPKAFDLGSFGLNMMQDGIFVPDDFRHEQYLLIEEHSKRVLISGCSHKGILNIAAWFSPDVLVGGFHFSKLPLDQTLTNYAAYLDGFDTAFYTCHCTGDAQFAFMKPHMKHLHFLSTGEQIIF